VISTRTRVLPDAFKVQFSPAQYDFTRKVWFPHKNVFWHLRLWLGHARVWFIHAECNFNTHSRIFTRRVWFYRQRKFDMYVCEKDTHEYDIYTLKCDSYTQSVVSTRSVISTSTKVIPTRTSVISTRRLWFQLRVQDWNMKAWPFNLSHTRNNMK
jgi:hypothetical protein